MGGKTPAYDLATEIEVLTSNRAKWTVRLVFFGIWIGMLIIACTVG